MSNISFHIHVCACLHVYRVRWVNDRHFKLLISRMCFICFGFCLLWSKPEAGIVRVKSSSMTQFTPPETWKWHAVLLSIHHGCTIRRFIMASVSIRKQIHIQSTSWCFGVVNSDGDVVSIHLLTWSQTQHGNILERAVLAWIERLIDGRPCIW